MEVPMKILVTAGATQVPIDKVRAITNIFRGRTGAAIAYGLARSGDHTTEITLIISDKSLAEKFRKNHDGYLSYLSGGGLSWVMLPYPKVIFYKTFAELAEIMERKIRTGNYDVVIHSAAVSDYEVEGVYRQTAEGALAPIDNAAKISSKHNALFLKLAPTFKIVDRIKREWGFKGKLVKFKLEVGKTDDELLDIARKSMVASDADIIVANCPEWARERAYIVDRDGGVESVTRDELAERLARRL